MRSNRNIIEDNLRKTFPHLRIDLILSPYYDGYELMVVFGEDIVERVILGYYNVECLIDETIRVNIELIRNIDAEYNSKLGKYLRGV